MLALRMTSLDADTVNGLPFTRNETPEAVTVPEGRDVVELS